MADEHEWHAWIVAPWLGAHLSDYSDGYLMRTAELRGAGRDKGSNNHESLPCVFHNARSLPWLMSMSDMHGMSTRMAACKLQSAQIIAVGTHCA